MSKKTNSKTNAAKKTVSIKRTIEANGSKTQTQVTKSAANSLEDNAQLQEQLTKDIVTDVSYLASGEPHLVNNQPNIVNEKSNVNNSTKQRETKSQHTEAVNKPVKTKEEFRLAKKNNNLVNYEKELLKIKDRRDKKKTGENVQHAVNYVEKYGVNNAVVKNKKRPFYETKQQTQGVKVVEKDKTNRLLAGITTVCIVALFAVVGRVFFLDNAYNNNSYSNNTTINGVNVGGLNTRDAQKLLASTFTKKAETFELTLTYKGKSWHFNKDNFKITSDIHTILEEAQVRDKANESYESQLDTINSITQSGKNINIAFNYIFVGLDEEIDKIIAEINYEPVNSELTFDPSIKGTFKITPHKTGLKVNKEQLYYEINEQFVHKNNVKVEIPTLVDEPDVTYEYNKSLTNKVAEFTSNVSDSTGNRKANVKLALSRINGLVVQPGESVSFNKLTGPHSMANGYKVATIIFNGQFVDGVGGGVCQASTTLYNALLLADLEIEKVSKHTLPVKYVPLALDAMVAEGVADLVFKNSHNYPIFIKATTTPENVTVQIYGHELEHGMTIKTRSEIIKQLPHGGDVIKQDVKGEHTSKVLYKGEQYRLTYPRNGFEAKAYLEYYKDGQFITRKTIRHEIYYPQQGIIIEGVEEKPAGFRDIESKVEKIKPSEVTDTFMLNMHDNVDLLEAVPTNFCP